MTATSAQTESFFCIGTKIGSSLDSFSTSMVTAATKQYLLPSAEASNATRSTFLSPMSYSTSCFFHTCWPILVFGEMSGLMMFEPLLVNGLSVLLPLRASIIQFLEVVTDGQWCILQFLEVVTDGRCEVELICFYIFQCHDVVLFEARAGSQHSR